jgi:hypothetical protein
MDNLGMDPDEACTDCCSLIDRRAIGELKARIRPQTMGPSRHVQLHCCRVIERQRVKLGGLSYEINRKTCNSYPFIMPVLERHATLVQSIHPSLREEYRISGRLQHLLI